MNHYNGFIDQYSASGDALTMQEVRVHMLQLRQQLSVVQYNRALQWQRPAAEVCTGALLCLSPYRSGARRPACSSVLLISHFSMLVWHIC